METRIEIAFERKSEVAAALDDGRLFVMQTDRPRYNPREWGGHVCAGAFTNHDGQFSTVHVMSKPAGVEIRGYVRIEGRLYARLPQKDGPWPEMDAEIERRLGAPVISAEVA